MQIIIFEMNKQFYGMHLNHIREISPYLEPTCIPNSQEYCEGLVSLRDETYLMVNLRMYFGLPNYTEEEKKNAQILISSVDNKRVCYLVDHAHSVNTVDEEAVEAIPLVHSEDMAHSIVKLDGQIVTLLNTEKVLACITYQ